MAEKSIVTGQYVRLRQTPASVGERMLAQVIDWVIQIAYFFFWMFIAREYSVSLSTFFIVTFIVLPIVLYCPLCELLMGGQTIGKKLIMLLVMILNRNNQRLGDMAAGTLVVKLHSYSKIQVSLDEYDYLTQGYHPSYPQAADLSLEQVDIIRRAIESDQEERISQLSQKVQQLLGITRRESEDEFFLRRIVRDYQYYALEEI